MRRKNRWNQFVIHCFILILLLSGLFQALAAAGGEGLTPRTLRVVMDNNYPPFAFLDGEGKVQGILVDQWRLWQKKTGIRVDIQAMDWGEALKAMKNGDFDVIDTIFATMERSGWLDFTEPYAKIEVPVFFRKEISGITDADSLKGFSVAVKEGDAAAEILRSHGVGNLMLFNGYEAIIRAAKEHKVNVFVIDKPPAMYFLYKYGIQDNYKESRSLYVGEFHRAVKKGNLTLLREIEAGFARISARERQQIKEKWYGSSLGLFTQARYFFILAAILSLLVLGLSIWNRALKKAVARRTRELKSSEERYRQLFNAASDAILVIDVQTLAHAEVNAAAVELYGYSHEELMALPSTEISAEPEETRFQVATGSGRIRIPLRYHKKKDGTVFPVEVTASFFELDGRKLVLAAMRDISERLLAEEALRENRRFLSDLIENSGALVFVKDCEGRYILINHKWEEVTGLRRQDVLGRTDEELFPGSVGIQFRKNDLDVLASGQVKELEEILESEKGNQFFLSIKFPLRNENGSITGICGMTTEITERRQAEEERERLRGQLSQAHKMESIGRLAGGIAHDFNNMIGVILGHTELALLAGTSSEQVRNDLEEIEKAARRSADLTRQMLAFARKQTVMPHTLDLNETVAGMLNMLGRLIGEDIELVWSPGDGLWPVKMDPSQIDQILANLCVNARDAIKDGGRVVISTENATISPTVYEKSEGCVAGDFVKLTMTDNGCGMDQETKSLLFEPFFTTKAVGKGTGLGLATVYGIVQQNRGFIEVESQPGRGTTFRVYLPRDGDLASTPAGEDAGEKLLSGKEIILLVEDEPANLAMARQMLEKIGYRVLTAGLPLDAIRLAQEHAGGIDLLMTDVIMPGMNGWELAKKMQEIRPGIKLLFTSGYTSTTIAHNSVIEEDINFIQKPFTLLDLSTRLRKALEKQTDGA